MRFVAAAFVPIAWLAASAAVACSCVPYRSAAEHIAATSLVFKGRVTGITRGEYEAVTRFQVLEVLKGQAGPAVRIRHQISDASCGVTFQHGATALVFANRGRGGAWSTTVCSAARFSEIEYRRGAAGEPAPSNGRYSVLRGTEPIVATYRPERSQGGVAGSATARLGGTLAERDRCLVIATDDGLAVQPVFPEGSARWEKETRRLIFNGTAYQIGSRITVGGGGIGDAAKFSARRGASIPKCGAVSLFIVAT